jgi:hypothetical protein
MILDNKQLIKNAIKGGIALNNQNQQYMDNGSTELANQSPVEDDKSLLGFVKGIAVAGVNNFLNSEDPPKNNGENFSNSNSNVIITDVIEEEEQKERENQNKNAIIKRSNNTEIVKRNNNSNTEITISQRFREKQKQKQNKVNNNLNNKNSIVVKEKKIPVGTGKVEEGHTDGDAISEANQVFPPANGTNNDNSSNNNNSSESETRIVKRNNSNGDDLSNFFNLKKLVGMPLTPWENYMNGVNSYQQNIQHFQNMMSTLCKAGNNSNGLLLLIMMGGGNFINTLRKQKFSRDYIQLKIENKISLTAQEKQFYCNQVIKKTLNNDYDPMMN